MKFIDEVSAEKLRGGFYTPAPLVVDCYRRIAELLPRDTSLRLLEPSAGDGAFIRYRDVGRLASRFAKAHTTCIELNASEASKCREALIDWGEDNAVRALEHRFAAVEYFACSQLGRPAQEDSGPFTAHGVYEPLDWVLL